MVAESWLRSPDHGKFAEAALRCELMGNGNCIYDAFCHLDGACFRRGRPVVMAACRAIEQAARKQPDDIAREMRESIRLLKETLGQTSGLPCSCYRPPT